MCGDVNSMAIMLDHRSTALGREFNSQVLEHREFWIFFILTEKNVNVFLSLKMTGYNLFINFGQLFLYFPPRGYLDCHKFFYLLFTILSRGSETASYCHRGGS